MLPNLAELGKTKIREQTDPLPEIREQEQETFKQFSKKVLDEKSKIKLLPNSAIREQLENGNTIVGKSLTKVKGKLYILTHANSDKHMPPNKGWLEIKPKAGKQYLYLRWRDGKSQRSRCLGRVDLVE